MRPEPQAVVRSTLPEAMAVAPALARTPLHGVLREPVDGEADTGDARRAAATSQGERGAKRRREEDAAVP